MLDFLIQQIYNHNCKQDNNTVQTERKYNLWQQKGLAVENGARKK